MACYIYIGDSKIVHKHKQVRNGFKKSLCGLHKDDYEFTHWYEIRKGYRLCKNCKRVKA